MGTKTERLAEVYRRVARLPRPSTAQESFDQFCDVLDEVEDEMSGVAKQFPPPADGGGRMYCPLADRTTYFEDGGIEAFSTGHAIRAYADGSIVISDRHTGEVEFAR